MGSTSPCFPSTIISYFRCRVPDAGAAKRFDQKRACLTPYSLDAAGVRTFRSECLPGVTGARARRCDVPYAIGATGVRTYRAECL